MEHAGTYSIGVDASHNGVTLFTFAHRVMIDPELLGDEVHNTPLFWRQRPGKSELVAHGVIFEEKDPRIDFKRRWIVEIELV